MSKNEKLAALIEAMVYKVVKASLPHVLKRVMSEIILESRVIVENQDFQRPSPTPTPRSRMDELVRIDGDLSDDYPTMGAGYRDIVQSARGTAHITRPSADLNVPSIAMSEAGNQIPITPDKVPDFVIAAMNKDYSGILQGINNGRNTL